MSEVQDKEIARLQDEVKVAQELLFLVLDAIGEPMTLNIEESKEKMTKDRYIDLQLDQEKGEWTLQVKDVE